MQSPSNAKLAGTVFFLSSPVVPWVSAGSEPELPVLKYKTAGSKLSGWPVSAIFFEDGCLSSLDGHGLRIIQHIQAIKRSKTHFN